jgi:hypothetical protein
LHFDFGWCKNELVLGTKIGIAVALCIELGAAKFGYTTAVLDTHTFQGGEKQVKAVSHLIHLNLCGIFCCD